MTDLKYPGLFITGTDTGVGKTVVTALLAVGLKKLGLDIGVFKPVASGALESKDGPVSTDAVFLKKFSGVSDTLSEINPIILRNPIAPSAAARMEGVTIDPSAIKSAFEMMCARHEFVLVEGAGGIMTPIYDTYLMRNLAYDLHIPCIVVARASLGTVNHTALTIHALGTAGIPILGVLINNLSTNPLAERTAAPLIEEVTGIKVLGEIVRDRDTDIWDHKLGPQLVDDCERWCKVLLNEIRTLPSGTAVG